MLGSIIQRYAPFAAAAQHVASWTTFKLPPQLAGPALGVRATDLPPAPELAATAPPQSTRRG